METQTMEIAEKYSVTSLDTIFNLKARLSGDNSVKAINGRTIHQVLDIKDAYTTWIKFHIEDLGLVEGKDFEETLLGTPKNGGPAPVDHIFTTKAARLVASSTRSEYKKYILTYLNEMEELAVKLITYKAPKTYIEALEETLRLAKINEAQKTQLEYTTPRAEWVDTYISHNGKMTIKDFGKILCTNKINDVDGSIITSKSIYDILRRYKYIGKRNQPNQKMINMKYMVIEPGLRTNPLNGAHICDKDGNTIPTYTTKITGEGEAYLTRMLTIRINKDIKDLEEDSAAE